MHIFCFHEKTVNVAAKRLAVSFFAVNHGRLGRSFSGRRIPVSGNRIFCRHGIPEHIVQNARGIKPDPDAGGFIGRGLCRKMGIPPPFSFPVYVFRPSRRRG
ncbi:MAG: hypothetical protein C6W56_16300 [Caldibacillus debilis]|nr:hypothetical protein [Bacillaceae bacterium]REJ22478.1 MAG: hypothetical protein C6W56_16300 [Caldibacillus debilis]